MNRPSNLWSQLCLLTSIIAILWGCANTGSPEGGPYDTTPPRLIGASPEPGATNVTGGRFVLRFDEFVKLSGQQEKLIISPASKTPARVTASGKHIYIRLEDSLLPNTTYSFYFDDAIVDNNEDNPLEDFSYTFSTGVTLDSMQLSGVVLDARTLEPVSGAVVGAHLSPTVTDSTLTKTPFTYVSKTNKMGRFTMRGLKDSTYYVFALTDNDNNYLYNLPAEGLAFSAEVYRTSKRDSVRTDTIKIDSIVRRDTLRRDSLVTYRHTYYEPSDIVLRHFVNEPRHSALLKYERRDSVLCRVEFSMPLDSLPQVRSLDYPDEVTGRLFFASADGAFVEYWLRDERLIASDSLRLALTYPKTDSLGLPHAQTDTLTFFKPTKPASSTRRDAGKATDETSPFRLSLGTTQGIYAQTPSDTVYLTTSIPIDSIADSLIRLEVTTDSLYQPAPLSIRQHRTERRRYELGFDKVYGQRYRLTIDSARLRSIYLHTNDSVALQGQTEAESELGTLELTIAGADSLLRVELLDKSGQPLLSGYTLGIDKADSTTTKPDSILGALLLSDTTAMATTPRLPSRRITFRDLKPSEYFVRAYIDRNADGQWTTGRYPDREPEPMYYSPETYAVKKGFTTREQWQPTARPLTEQKPESLRKARPEEKRRREDKNIEYYKRMGQKKKRK